MQRAAPETNLERSPLSLVDDVGAVFLAPGRVLRGIRGEAAAGVEALLAADWMHRLTDQGLLIGTRRSESSIPGFAFALEHPRLPVVTYPYEWSFGMLRDAAGLILRLNEELNHHGWELKDCHAYNVLFAAHSPVYVDFGSLIPRSGRRGWIAYDQYLCAYDYPLRIWRDGGEFIARRLMAASDLMRPGDYALYRWPLFRLGGRSLYEKIASVKSRYRLLSRHSDEKLKARLPAGLAQVVVALRRWGWMPGQDIPLSSLRRRLLHQRRRNVGSVWGNYQAGGAGSVSTPRFDRIVSLLRELGVRSTIELGGNQGWLSERLLSEGVVDRALCTDSDELAVDHAYERVRSSRGKLHLAVLDFVHPMTTPFGLPPADRLRADAALALAVSHHILLTQRIPVERLLGAVEAYASRHVFIEFMPLGLWTGRGAAPPVPSWYHQDMFQRAMEARFDQVRFEKLEENRVLFRGIVRSGESG